MAVAYKNARQAIGTTYTTAYTCPTATTALVLLAQVANVDGTNSADVSAQWLDSSNSNTATRLMEMLTIAAKNANNIIGGPVILEAGDVIQFKASDSSRLEVSLSIREESFCRADGLARVERRVGASNPVVCFRWMR
jgi:hypothetical protein